MDVYPVGSFVANDVQLGRCGNGAVQLAKDVGIPESNIMQWDMAETKKG